MVESGVDYVEEVDGTTGYVTGATLQGAALELAQAGAQLASYGVHGTFSDVNF